LSSNPSDAGKWLDFPLVGLTDDPSLTGDPVRRPAGTLEQIGEPDAVKRNN